MKVKIKESAPDPRNWRSLPEVWAEFLGSRQPQYCEDQLFWCRLEKDDTAPPVLCYFHPRLITNITETFGKPFLMAIQTNHILGLTWWDVASDAYKAQLVKDHCIVVTGPE